MQDQLKTIYSILSGPVRPRWRRSAWPFIFLMATSLAGSLLASYLYLQFYSSRATGSQVYRAFPLLGLSITAIFVCIQFSLPLSLGLLGALSIVRFRTPIKEPEEIGFIMLVIAASIATATFKLAFVGILFGVALVALVLQRASGRVGARQSTARSSSRSPSAPRLAKAPRSQTCCASASPTHTWKAFPAMVPR